MDWTWYFFRFTGRTCRAEFWCNLLFAFCGVLLLVFVCALIILPFVETGSFSLNANDVFKIVDPASYHWSLLDNLPRLLLKLAATALALWVYLAIMVKRLHDRDKSAWWLVAFFVLPGLNSQFEDRLPDSKWMLALALASGCLYIWGLIELGFLRGTPRANRFGPDPLSEPETEAAGPHKPGWDQQSALEFVPHSASPPDGMHVKRDA